MANFDDLGNPIEIRVEVDEVKSHRHLATLAVQPTFKNLTCEQALIVAWWMEYESLKAVEEYKQSLQKGNIENIVKNASASMTGLINAVQKNLYNQKTTKC